MYSVFVLLKGRWLCTCLGFALSQASLCAPQWAAQNPGFGTDTGSYRATVTANATFDVAGESLTISMKMALRFSSQISLYRTDTLKVTAVLDSVDVSAVGSGVDVQGESLKRGDSVVFLLTRRGAFAGALSSDSAEARMVAQIITGGVLLPESWPPRGAWFARASDLPSVNASFLDEATEVDQALTNTISISNAGMVDRGGVRVWKFEMSGATSAAAGPVAQARVFGEAYLDTMGRLVYAEQSSHLTLLSGTGDEAVSTSSKAEVVIERIASGASRN
jgi:hypothetical protein